MFTSVLSKYNTQRDYLLQKHYKNITSRVKGNRIITEIFFII